MLQRIQTLWLILASVASFLALKLSFYSGTEAAENGIARFRELTGSSLFLVMVLTVACGIGALIIVFLYKDRKIQLRLSLAILVLSVVCLVMLYLETRKFQEGNYALSSLVFLAIPIFIFLAIRGIYRDEKLIKSADRLR